jgi:hypothetical protein
MDKNFEVKKDFLENLRSIIKFREESISLIRKVIEKSESKVQNQKDIKSLTDKIMSEFSQANNDYDENELQLLKNTLEIVFEKQLEFSKKSIKIRLLKNNPPSIFK